MTAPADGPALPRSLWLLRDDVIFLNHGSFGACPWPVFDAYQQWQRELEAQPVEFLATDRRLTALLAEARMALGHFLNVAADDLVYVTNATSALNIVARSLRLGPGDEVLGNDHEYGALARTWQFLCEKQGAHYRALPLPLPVHSAEELVERIWSAVTPQTRVLFLSHITSPTALTLPVEPLIARARAAGILTVVDGAHVPGQRPLDLATLGADFYSGNLHKWCCAPKGSAFLYARRELQPLLEPLVVSWGWQSDSPGPSRFVDEQEYQGTRDPSAWLATATALDFLAAHDWPQVRAACHALARYARSELAALTNLEPLHPDDPAWYSQMVAAPLPPCDVATLKRTLYDDYRIEVPVYQWAGQPMIRLSIQAYNRRSDVDALLAALREKLPGLAPA